MARVTITSPASEQLRQNHHYIARDSPSAAARLIRCIRADIRLLARHPQQGREVPEYADPTIRELIVPPYRVEYRFTAGRDLVQVVAVYHSAQLLPAWPPNG